MAKARTNQNQEEKDTNAKDQALLIRLQTNKLSTSYELVAKVSNSKDDGEGAFSLYHLSAEVCAHGNTTLKPHGGRGSKGFHFINSDPATLIAISALIAKAAAIQLEENFSA